MQIPLMKVTTCYLYILGTIGGFSRVSADSAASFKRGSSSSSGAAQSSSSFMRSSSLSAGASGGGGGFKGNANTTNGGGTGPASGGGSGESTSSNNEQKALNLQQNNVLNTALNQLSAQQLPGGAADKFANGSGSGGAAAGRGGVDPLCDPKLIEGNWNVIKEEQKKKCLEQTQQKKDLAEKLIKKTSPNECVVKINSKALICHAKNVIKKIVESPFWDIKKFGNAVGLYSKGHMLAMAVVETMNYKVTKIKSPEKEHLKEPTLTASFNELGGLLSQKGELPVAKTDDPCAACLTSLNKKANSMEGMQDSCSTNCESTAIMDLVKPGHFKEVNAPEKPEEQPKKKPEPEEGGEEEA